MIIGLDVGGTHTDVVLLDKQGLVKDIKVHTDSSDLFGTVLLGLEKITEGVDPEMIKRVVLSTTLTTNSIVQGKTPEVGMIISSGPGIDPGLYRTNPQYHMVSGAIDHRGRTVEPLDHDEIKEVGRQLKADGIKYIGVVGKFSARNPIHEMEIHQLLQNDFHHIFLGHRVSGNLNFPRRIATTFLNASVYPTHKEFFEAVGQSLDKKGLKLPIHILKADGGTMSFESSIDFPGQTILSGPAASVMGAIAFAPPDEDVIVLDIGGTTTDIAVLINQAPVLDPLGIELGGYKTLIRSLKTRSIAIGGDSLVQVSNGEIKIGPERLDFAMAYGGKSPTPTDALVAIENIEGADVEKAKSGIASIAQSVGTSLEATALYIFSQTCQRILFEAQKMVTEINSKPVYTVHELQEGYQVNPKKILVLGGPAPYFARHLENISNFQVQAIPGWKVANAMGAALARTTCEVTLFADTSQGILNAPEEDFEKRITKDFSVEDAVEKAYDLLKHKAIEKGANPEDLEMELLENLQFNMVRGFSTTGKNIRIKAQVKPGLIHRYESVTQNMSLGFGSKNEG